MSDRDSDFCLRTGKDKPGMGCQRLEGKRRRGFGDGEICSGAGGGRRHC